MRYIHRDIDMKTPRAKPQLEHARRSVATHVRELRRGRGWTQAELAARLHLSQNRLSELERGAGSFTAEQLLVILKLFNVPVSLFGQADEADQVTTLQNALARLGALELQESDRALPSERLEQVNDVIREAVLSRAPRLITAIAPVLARNADRVNLHVIDDALLETGLSGRLPWVVDNTIEALTAELAGQAKAGEWANLRRRVDVPFRLFLDFVAARHPHTSKDALDMLDVTIRSRRTLEEVQRRASPPSVRWGIATSLQVADFVEALRASRVAG
jgi:HTH-type transcriptional regulator/antitoxin HipB